MSVFTIRQQSDKDKATTWIRNLDPDIEWDVVVRRHKRKRSNPQNRYYWGVVIKILADETGNSANDLHDYLLGECFGWVEYQVMDKTRVRPARGTSDMTTEQFEAYCEWCRAFGAQQGYYIPHPNEVPIEAYGG